MEGTLSIPSTTSTSVTPDQGSTSSAQSAPSNSAQTNPSAHKPGQSGPSRDASGKFQPQSGTATTQSAQPSPEQAAKAIRELGDADMDAVVTIKVNGEAKRVTLRELTKISQLESASHEKMQKASQMERQARQALQMLKENPRAVMQHLGIDPYEFAEMTLAEKIELMQMTPEQRELQEFKRERDERQKGEKEHEEIRAKEREAVETRQAEEHFSKEIAAAFKVVGLPPSKLYFEQITAQMLYADKRGETLSAEEAASRIKARFTTNLTDHMRTLDVSTIRELIGDQKWNELREQDLRRVQDPLIPNGGLQAARPGQTQAKRPSGIPQSKAKPVLTEREWRAQIEALKTR